MSRDKIRKSSYQQSWDRYQRRLEISSRLLKTPRPRVPWYQKHFGALVAFLAFIQPVIIVAGVPVGIITYIITKQIERRNAESATYEKLNDRYIMYEGLALRYVGLDVSDAGVSDENLTKLLVPRNQLTSQQRIQERQLMFMLIAMYEQAYVNYADKSEDFKQEQWRGWVNGLKRWCRRVSFRQAWARLGEDFDIGYQDFVNKLLREPGCSMSEPS
jgi:hypothetical protein